MYVHQRFAPWIAGAITCLALASCQDDADPTSAGMGTGDSASTSGDSLDSSSLDPDASPDTAKPESDAPPRSDTSSNADGGDTRGPRADGSETDESDTIDGFADALEDAEDTSSSPDGGQDVFVSTDAAGDITTDAAEPTDGLTLQDASEPKDAWDAEETDASTPPSPLFDLALLADVEDTSCTFAGGGTSFEDGVILEWWNVEYRSYEVVDGVVTPIWIRGYAARPALAPNALPGVVVAHGLGGAASLAEAQTTAALVGAFTLAYTGPGGGTEPANTSEGTPSGAENGYRMFDTLKDPRGSWFWGHAAAAMRALTCLSSRPDVDQERLGMTGYSAGAVATLTVAAWDPRLIAAVPLSGTAAWDVATQSPQAWQHALLTAAGLTASSAEWTTLLATVVPTPWLGQATAEVFLVNGTSDEFFPLTAHMATVSALANASVRHALVGNFDHGCFALTGGEPGATIEERAALRARGAQRAAFHHAFGTDSTYAVLPAPPTLQTEPAGALTAVTAIVDEAAPGVEVTSVRYWWSNDDAFLWGHVELPPIAGGLYGAFVPVPTGATTLQFVDVEYSDGALLFPERFSVSSFPSLPPGHVPHIRAIDTCL